MPFAKGQSGNPKGRPPKARALTGILEMRAWQELEHQGQTLPSAEVIADMLWSFALSGTVTFPDGRLLRAESMKEWFNIVRWLYVHMEGPAIPQPDDTPVEVRVIWEATLPGGHGAFRQEPSEDDPIYEGESQG